MIDAGCNVKEKLSEIPEAMGNLEATIGKVRALITDLHIKLKPVLHEDPEDAKNNEAKGYDVPLVSMIAGNCRVLDGCAVDLANILENCEL